MSTDRPQPIIATALATARLGAYVPHALRGTLNGFWLGVLDDAALRALDERLYRTVDLYATREWNARGLMDWEQSAVAALFEPGMRLLVVGCGGGREVLALLRAGYDAHGCEPHPLLVKAAEQLLAEHGHPGRIAPAPRDTVPVGPPGDGVILGWGVYSLVAGGTQRVGLLRGARDRLVPGGALMLSCFGHTGPGRELAWTRGLANTLRRARRAAPVELGDTLAPSRVHVFTRAELEGEAAAAGLELARWQPLAVADGGTRYTLAALRAP